MIFLWIFHPPPSSNALTHRIPPAQKLCGRTSSRRAYSAVSNSSGAGIGEPASSTIIPSDRLNVQGGMNKAYTCAHLHYDHRRSRGHHHHDGDQHPSSHGRGHLESWSDHGHVGHNHAHDDHLYVESIRHESGVEAIESVYVENAHDGVDHGVARRVPSRSARMLKEVYEPTEFLSV